MDCQADQWIHPTNIQWVSGLSNCITTQYWMDCQADQWIHPMNIRWVSGISDGITHSILDGLSGGPMNTPNEYSVGIRPIQLYHHSILDGLSGGPIDTSNEYLMCIRLIRRYHPLNIGWTVRRTNGYTQQIFSEYPAYPTVSPLNIGWTVRRTNGYTQ